MDKKIYLIQEGCLDKKKNFNIFKIKDKKIARGENQYLIKEKTLKKIIKRLKKKEGLRKTFKWDNECSSFNELSKLGIEIFEFTYEK